MEKESKSVGLKKEDAKNQARWRVGVGEIAGRVGETWPPSFTGIKLYQNWIDDDDDYSKPNNSKEKASPSIPYAEILRCRPLLVPS